MSTPPAVVSAERDSNGKPIDPRTPEDRADWLMHHFKHGWSGAITDRVFIIKHIQAAEVAAVNAKLEEAAAELGQREAKICELLVESTEKGWKDAATMARYCRDTFGEAIGVVRSFKELVEPPKETTPNDGWDNPRG